MKKAKPENLKITKADKRNCVLILDKSVYVENFVNF